MVGANYMGGKRNTARAKSKDVIGRAQRRHFGKQRLASALCATQETRVHPSAPTFPSALPEITLAHARCDASTDSGATSSRKVFSGDRLYSPKSPNNTTQRNKPSKILGALNISDQDMSMRAAIDRILQQPSLVGINTPKPKETACIERMQTPVTVRRPTETHLDSDDPDTRHSEIVSKRDFEPPGSHSQIPEHDHTSLPGTDPNMRYEVTESGVLSPPDSPRICDVTSWNAFDDSGYAEAQLFAGGNPFLYTEGNELEKPSTFLDAVHPLPRSSPFPSGSHSPDNSILDLDTSPWAAIWFGRSDDLPENDDDCVDASSLHSIRQPSWSCYIREGSAGVGEEELEPERSRTTCYDKRAFPSTGNNELCTFPPEHGRDSIQFLTSQKVTEDNVPSGISIDFLSDPHPWETIGRILKLEPLKPPAAQSMKISFTKGREGVGCVSPERSGICNARSSAPTSFEMRTDDQSTDDIHVTSSAGPPLLEIADLEVPNADDRTAVDTPDSPCANNSTWPLFNAAPPSTTLGEDDPYTQVHSLQEVPSILVVRCTRNEHSRFSNSLAIIAGTTEAESDVDMTFDGPCLFGDSDLEEEE
ncbi:hypothetical protein J3R83DRAFT_685 [Lanmaoa asiatica]|nr:hypothetical protein J3R83DRAFT_685 [Lanmaoa asiatica]